MSSLVWEGFGQHKLRYILCLRWNRKGLVNTGWDTLCFLALLRYILCTRWHERDSDKYGFFRCCLLNGISLVNTFAANYVFLSTKFEKYFVSSLAREGLVQHMLRCILCFAGLGGVWATQVEINFVSSLGWDGFCQHIFCVIADMGLVWFTHVEMNFLSLLGGRGLVNTSWDTFTVFAGIRGFRWTQLEIHIVTSMTLGAFG